MKVIIKVNRIKIKIVIITTLMMGLLVGCTSEGKQEAQQVSGEMNLAGAYQEMNNPSFWISRVDNPDEVLLSTKEIEEFNK